MMHGRGFWRILPKKTRVFAVWGNHRGNNLPWAWIGVRQGAFGAGA
jgi:hypothetical protein